MLIVKNVKANVGEKEILAGVNMELELGKNYVVLGKNGSGKSTLSAVIAGNPKYTMVSWEITLDGEDVLTMTPEERSLKGIFLSFQNVPEIKWVNLAEYLRTIYNNALKKKSPDTPAVSPFIFKRLIKKFTDELKIDESFLGRDLNVGFSWGEKRKIEILQMKLLEPRYIILDEIDSGLDVDAFRTIAELLKSVDSEKNTIVIITHYFNILEYVPVESVFVMKDGLVVKQWGVQLIDDIKIHGFENM